MKKLTFVIAVLGILGLSSCKQDWVCQCVNDNGEIVNTPINGGTFHHAEHTCKGLPGKCSLITLER